MTDTNIKTCPKCKQDKPYTKEFYYSAKGKLARVCKPCANAISTATRDKKKAAENARRYRAAKPKKPPREVMTPEEKREANRLKSKRWRDKNPEKQRAASRAWQKANPEKVKEINRKANKVRNSKPKNRIASNVRNAIRRSFIRGKSDSGYFSVLPYSCEELIAHLERQFLPGMTLENYGEWHVDHIIPLSSFDYNSVHDAEFQACWALSNLRPLWAIDNIKKGPKVEHLI